MVSLEAITKSETHIHETYRLLQQRSFSISRENTTSIDQHKQFVLNHPYREWFFVVSEKTYCGTVYLHQDNSIGLNLLHDFAHLSADAIRLVLSLYEPLPAIPSVRNKHFIVNVAPNDQALTEHLQKLGATHIQSTFVVKP